MKLTFTLFLFLLFAHGLSAQEGFLGEIRMTGANFAPRGWALCEGQLLPIQQYQALYSILGTQYGGDGRTTFALPDFRSRTPIHVGQGNSTTGTVPVTAGQKLGTEWNTLVANNLPAHNHTLYAVSENGSSETPAGNYLANTKLLDPEYSPDGTLVQMNAGMVGTTGLSQSVENMQPSLAINYIICLQGLFPSRN